MTIRCSRPFGGAALALALMLAPAGARADVALFGSYWANVARAAAENDAAELRQLLANGHSPDEADDRGRTGLQIAAINGNLQIAELLLKAGAHTAPKDMLGNTALHYAADRNHLAIVELLLEAGAAVDPENHNGMTPLMLAASRGSLDIVRALLAKGASVRIADLTGRNAMNWAEDSHRPAVVQAIERAAAKR
jgi:uncharacterized protein